MDFRWSTQTIESLDELFGTLDRFRKMPDLAFRGQCNDAWPLTPQIDRGVPAETDYGQRLLDESGMIEAFSVAARRFLGPVERTFLRGDRVLRLTVMQHYGAPTRLLDWTMSAPIAAYFACIGGEAVPGCIWWVDTRKLTEGLGAKWDSAGLERTLDDGAGGKSMDWNAYCFTPRVVPLAGLIFFPREAFHRVYAQRGLFTICTCLGHPHNEVVPQMIAGEPCTAFGRLVIPAHLKEDALMHLERMGIDAVSIGYAGADCCGLRMSWERGQRYAHSNLTDEAIGQAKSVKMAKIPNTPTGAPKPQR